jgi:hypothetical protein
MFSNAVLQYSKWYHIALVFEKGKVKLYVNSFLDSIIKMKNTYKFVQNKHDFIIGNHPKFNLDCQSMFLMDDFKIYKRALP